MTGPIMMVAGGGESRALVVLAAAVLSAAYSEWPDYLGTFMAHCVTGENGRHSSFAHAGFCKCCSRVGIVHALRCRLIIQLLCGSWRLVPF